MNQVWRWQRIGILSLLLVSVFAPIVLVSNRLKTLTSHEADQFMEDLSGVAYERDRFRLQAVEMVDDKGMNAPPSVVYRDNIDSVITSHNQTHKAPNSSASQLKSDLRKRKRVPDEKVKEMKDELIRAKVYLSFAPVGSSSHLVKELKLRIKEVERAVRDAAIDTDLSRSSLRKKRLMESTLSKAGAVYSGCASMVARLRALNQNAEEQVRAQQRQASYLLRLSLRTTSKGLHCLTMRLSSDYFALRPGEGTFDSDGRLSDPDLHHFAVFSDNVLACAVVVNSTISSAMEKEKIVFHVVTDSLNHPAISMWFLKNPPEKSAIEVRSSGGFSFLPSDFDKKNHGPHGPDDFPLNRFRFFLPDIFPSLKKIVFLDHDVVVQKDLAVLWNATVPAEFNSSTPPWAFGINMFDLDRWRHRSLAARYTEYLNQGMGRWPTFHEEVILDRRWHVVGLGHVSSGAAEEEIETAAVIHYDGMMKPWSEVGIRRYKPYWSKYLSYHHPFLQQCNIRE